MFIWLVRSAYAAPIDIGKEFGPAQSGFTTTSALVNVLLPNLLTIAGVIAFIGIVFSGFNMISHAGMGESDKTTKDKQAFTASVTGLIIIFGAYFLIQIVSTLFGYNILSPNIQ